MKYLIAYQFADAEDSELDSIPNAIFNLDPDATNCFDNVWLIKTTANTSDISKRLSKFLQPQDRLIVSAAGDSEFVGFDVGTTAWLMDKIDE
jgi:hypothetical protein